MTNAGEYLAGAYYSICMDSRYILYNQSIYFEDFDENFPYNWTKEGLQEVFKDGHFYLDKVEIDVVAGGGDYRIIAECTERSFENRPFEKIRRKFYGALAYDAMNGSDTNLRLELWAPTVSTEIKNNWKKLENELKDLHKNIDSEYSTLSLTLVSDEMYKSRIEDLISRVKNISHNKLDNPVFRTLQLLNRAGYL